MGVFDEAYFGTKSVQRLDAEFKQTTNYILLKYIYVLRSQMQLRELEDEIKISRDDRIQEKLTMAAEVLKKEEMAICKRQVLSSKKWQLISSIFWQLSTSILYTPTDCSVGIFY